MLSVRRSDISRLCDRPSLTLYTYKVSQSEAHIIVLQVTLMNGMWVLAKIRYPLQQMELMSALLTFSHLGLVWHHLMERALQGIISSAVVFQILFAEFSVIQIGSLDVIFSWLIDVYGDQRKGVRKMIILIKFFLIRGCLTMNYYLLIINYLSSSDGDASLWIINC